jgi:hypothetical protein
MLLICAHLKKPVVHSRADMTTQERANPYAPKPAALLTRSQYREEFCHPVCSHDSIKRSIWELFPIELPGNPEIVQLSISD